jgi:hypothetical protein
MLEYSLEIEKYFAEVEAFAAKIGKSDQLKAELDYLDTYAEHGERAKSMCVLFKDFAPYSFGFTMYLKNDQGTYVQWFHGGLIYHGAVDGFGSCAGPTFSVTVNPNDGWSVHT